MPFSLACPFSIRRFNFFCFQVLLTRASLLALAKSIYYADGTDAMRQQENEMKSLQKAFNNFHLVKVSRYLMQYFH